MKSKLVVMMVGSAFVVMFVEVKLVRAELWINPLFEFSSIAANMSLVKLSDGSVMVVGDNATRTTTDNGVTFSDPRPMYDGQKPGIPRMGPIVRTAAGVIVLVYSDVSTYHWEWDDTKGEPADPQGLDTWAIRSDVDRRARR